MAMIPGEEKRNEAPALPATGSQVLEIISSAWPEEEVDYHKLFLFDRIRRGDREWGFLVVTRSTGAGRLELAAFSFATSRDGKLTTRLESRKARIPADRLAEVVEGVLLRLDEFECDYREYSLAGFAKAPSRLDFLRRLFGEEQSEVSDDTG
jgi:hypothetical protein